MRLAVLASGRGSNLRAILDAIARGDLDAEVVGVFSDRAKATALDHARSAGVHAASLNAKGYPSREAFDEAMFSLVDAVHPDLIVCAGYMRLMSAEAVNPRLGRMINIHPSLLPAFKGLHTHQQALDAGVAEHGASVHAVIPELDAGPLLAQVRVIDHDLTNTHCRQGLNMPLKQGLAPSLQQGFGAAVRQGAHAFAAPCGQNHRFHLKGVTHFDSLVFKPVQQQQQRLERNVPPSHQTHIT